MEYEAKTHTLLAALNYQVNQKLTVGISSSYSDSKAKIRDLVFDSTQVSGTPAGYNYDLSEVDNYSELDIQQLDFAINADYRVRENISMNIGFNYRRYDDDEPYLEDGTGEAYLTNISLLYRF
ncbi:MAG: MtrB/PioB family outer membrane beta-barrel protein [Proteobacteria bacterium]|nr:MtrB/PioB family outer membrane beta-barrel protein [Pseudomonadota bacterium]